jgi:DNA-binding YbaB/EbfC family protein
MNDALGTLMKHAQEIQENLKKAQDEMLYLTATGESGGGMVKVTLTGKHEAKKVEIDPLLLKDDKEVVEDLIAAAITDAARRVSQATQEKMMSAAGGMQLPPGFKFPF